MDIENPILSGKNMFSANYGHVDDESILGCCEYCEEDIFYTQDYASDVVFIYCNNICKKLYLENED